MAVDLAVQKTLDRVFIVTLLLTGERELAEEAVLDGIASLDSDCRMMGDLMPNAIKGAIQRRRNLPVRRADELEGALALLPSELQAVLHLQQDDRSCFVLRVLAGLPRETCASLLQVNLAEVEQRTLDAMQSLAVFEETRAAKAGMLGAPYSPSPILYPA